MAMIIVALSIVFVCLWFYSRAARREKLEMQWDKDQGPGRRESFVAAEMLLYEGILKRKLIWGVYVVPGSLLAILIYLTNMG